MTLDYNEGQNAERYKQAKMQPWRSRIESYSFMNLIGDLRGKSVLDLACGEGHYTRKLRQSGADRVVGSDLSERMIELARAQEAAEPLGIEYRVEDAATITSQENFDLVVAAWLLVYAHDREELERMCRAVASRLRPGGRFVTLINNPELCDEPPRPDFRKYGFDMTVADHVFEGAPILWTILLEGASLDIENYYLPMSAYKLAFQEAGFGEFQLHRPELAPNPLGVDDSSYWQELLDHPAAVLIDCIKQPGRPT